MEELVDSGTDAAATASPANAIIDVTAVIKLFEMMKFR